MGTWLVFFDLASGQVRDTQHLPDQRMQQCDRKLLSPAMKQ